MKSKENDIQVMEGNIMEGKSSFFHGRKWSLAKRGTLEDALKAFLPSRNIPYKAQLTARSKELDQTLDDIVKRSEEAFLKDTKYAKKPSITKPPLEDIIPMVPNVGYERNVTLGLEKYAKGKIRAGIRVLYGKNGEDYRFMLPLSECSNVAPQIVKAAEATAEFLAEHKFDVSDGLKHWTGILGIKYAMNEIGEIIMSLLLVIDPDGPPEEESDDRGDKVENMIFSMPGGPKKQLREFFFKSNVTCQIKEHIRKYSPTLKKFVEDNRARLGVVGVYITWLDAETSPEVKPVVRPWYHVAGDESLTLTFSSIKLEFFPHLENIHPSTTQAITAVVNTIFDGLSLQAQSGLILLISEFYLAANFISQKFKKTAVLEALQKPLQSYLKEMSRRSCIQFVSLLKDNRMKLLHDQNPEAVIHWGHLMDDEVITLIKSLNRYRRPRKIAWVIDSREDSADLGGNKCSNEDLLERNHSKLYPYYILDRLVGIDVAPQKGEQLTLVAFYKRYDGDIKLNDGQMPRIGGNAKDSPKTDSKVSSNERVRGGPDTKRKASDQQGQGSLNAKKRTHNQRGPGGSHEEKYVGAQKGSNKGRSADLVGPIGAKRQHRGSSPQPGRRGPSRHMSYARAREPTGPGKRPQNPWADNNYVGRQVATPDQTAFGVMSQLTNVIGKQLLLTQMNSALQLASSSNTMDDARLDGGLASDHGGYDWPPQRDDNFSPPPPPRQLPTTPPRSRAEDVSLQGAREDFRSSTVEDIARGKFRNTSRENFAGDNYRSDVRGGTAHGSVRSTLGEEFSKDECRSVARQEFTSDDFWKTPLEDLTHSKFKSASSPREKIGNISISYSRTRDEFPREDYESSSAEVLTRSNLFKNADQEELRGGTLKQGTVRAMSPYIEDFTPRNFRTTQDDFVHGDFEIAAREDIVIGKLRRTTRESSNHDYVSRAAHEDIVSERLRRTAKENSTSENTSRAAQSEFRRGLWEDSDISHGDFSRREFRSPTRERSRSALRRDNPYNNFRSIAEEDITRDSRNVDEAKRAVQEISTFSALRRGLTFDNFSSPPREDITEYNDSRNATCGDSPITEFRRAPWEDDNSAFREDFSHKDLGRAERGEFNRVASYSSRSAAREDFEVEHRDNVRNNLSKDEFFGSSSSYSRGPRDSFDSSGRNSWRDRNSDYRRGHTEHRDNSRDTPHAGGGRYSRDQDVRGGDFTRRNY